MESPNLSYIDKLSNGDDAFKAQLIHVIKTEFPDEKEIYFSNINTENFIKAAENVHKLKHKISILGLEESYKVAAAYEDNLKSGDMTLKDNFQKILETITQYLGTL